MEIWKDVKNYEGIYQISNFGQVRNNKKILKPTLKRGYLQIGLRKNGIENSFKFTDLLQMLLLAIQINCHKLIT